MKRPHLFVSMSPHRHSGRTVRWIIGQQLLALVPAVLAGWYFFGWGALVTVLIGAAAALATEYVWQRMTHAKIRVADGNAVLVGALLGLLLTSEAPWWLPVLGAVVAIVVGKELFGGLGSHPFNAALVGWAFVQVSYKELLTSYSLPNPLFFLEPGEYLTDPPLIALRDDISWILELPIKDLFLGNVPGEIGTVSVLALLLGGLYLLGRRVIAWQIPVAFIAGVAVFASIFWWIDPEVYASPLFHVLAGWTLFGAFFLAPAMGTAPVTPAAMIIYGAGCGILTMIIRIWGGYAEGVPFAILLMNAMTPLLDRIKPRALGRVKEIA